MRVVRERRCQKGIGLVCCTLASTAWTARHGEKPVQKSFREEFDNGGISSLLLVGERLLALRHTTQCGEVLAYDSKQRSIKRK